MAGNDIRSCSFQESKDKILIPDFRSFSGKRVFGDNGEMVGSMLKISILFQNQRTGLYNPFSLLWTLCDRKYGSYWFETGTPTFLVELLQKYDCNLETMSRFETDADTLNSIFTDDNPIPVIYQGGYLTIKGYDKRFGLYTLGFPNKEVEDGFVKYLVPFYTQKQERVFFRIE